MKTDKLKNINSTGFKTPESYFDSFNDKLMNKIEEETPLNQISEHGFKVPSNYFKSVEDSIIQSVSKQKNSKVNNLFTWRTATYVTGVAASILLIISIFNNTVTTNISFGDIETTAIENYISEENYTNIEIASLLTDEELSLDNFTENTFIDASLEDYLLEQPTIEDLLID